MCVNCLAAKYRTCAELRQSFEWKVTFWDQYQTFVTDIVANNLKQLLHIHIQDLGIIDGFDKFDTFSKSSIYLMNILYHH